MILSSLFSCPPLASTTSTTPATTMGGWMGSPEIPFVQNNASWPRHQPRPRTATTRPSPTPAHTHTPLLPTIKEIGSITHQIR
uniref:Putative secreted protein n=1 Tax=Anopheles darlingi TaxID=43151 RepID=A0A2M4D3K7_ANODA